MNWISLEDDSPPNNVIFLGCDIYNNFVSLCCYDEQEDQIEIISMDNVEIDSLITHWIPIPSLPQVHED